MEITPPTTKTFTAIALFVASLVIAGCGNNSKADLANGKTLFAAKCGSCHTLARTQTARGVIGPNLDDAFRRAKIDGMGASTVEGVVVEQIAFPSQGLHPAALVMPKDLVTGMDARDVAAYVGYAAGEPGKDTGALATAGAPAVSDQTVTADASNHLKIDAVASGATQFDAGKATAKAGKISFEMDNPSGVGHNIALKGAGVNVLGKIVSNGGKSEITATVKPGSYTFFCSVPGHEAGGMKGTLTVK